MADDRLWNRPFDEIIAIESLGEDAFNARVGGFGGETLGCAALAAARSCPAWWLHSLHAYFLRPVPNNRPIQLVVERLRDGRRFAHRRVQVRADGRLLSELVASFAAPASGREYQETTVDANLPDPEDLLTEEQIARAEGWILGSDSPVGGPLEWRWSEVPWRVDPAGGPSRYVGWVRPRHPLPQDPAVQAAAIAFLSDYHSHFPVARKLGAHFDASGYTSLDQVLWLHRNIWWDDWWLLRSESDVGHAGRALSRRLLFTRDGRLVASMAQEQLIPGAASL